MLFQSIYNKYFLPKFITYVQLAAGKTTHAEEYLKKKGFTNTTVIPVGLDIQAFLFIIKTGIRFKEYSIPKDNINSFIYRNI